MTSYDDPWSEDYEDAYHEEDYEMSEDEELAMQEEKELALLDEDTLYEKKLNESMEEEYEYDEIVGGRDKKPVLSALNKKNLSKYELDELFNQMG
jgi:hypothetical protein